MTQLVLSLVYPELVEGKDASGKSSETTNNFALVSNEREQGAEEKPIMRMFV